MGYLGRVISAIFNRPPARQSGDASPIRARYDAAQSSGMNTNHWTAADTLDADSANSKTVRQTIAKRARYETENNGHGKGIVLTQANYVVGRGPKLRMQTKSAGFNGMVEAAWQRWVKSVKLSRRLRTAIKAKVRDGESFLRVRTNPRLADRVKLDLVPLEAEQVSTPYLDSSDENKIDGINFDDWGNRDSYEILTRHPGSSVWSYPNNESETVPAKFVLHLFREDRPGQHRAVSEVSSTLNLFATGRRFRESTVVAAENGANFSLFLKTQASPNVETDQVTPLSTLPVEKGMLTALPYGFEPFQLKPEQPAATYESFTRANLAEEARPLSMPYNIAACDSSGYSFSGGKLDHLTYFVSVDVEQEELETEILDPLFSLWFAEAVRVYGWAIADTETAPPHAWNWPARPQIDDAKTASARQTDLKTGVRSLRRIYEEDGYDLEDELAAMAEDYGLTVDEMRKRLLEVNLGGGAGVQPQQSDAGEDDNEDPPPRRSAAPMPSRNGTNGKVAV